MKRIQIIIVIAAISLAAFAQEDPTDAFSESYTHEYNKDYQKAIEALQVHYKADFYEANLRMGWLHYLTGDYLKSQRYYKTAMNLKPESIEAMFGYVYPLAALENWNEVVETYKTILKLDPENYTANIRMANIFYYRKDFNQALSYAKMNWELYPFDYATNLVMGQIHIGLGKINEAKEYLEVAQLYYPESEDVKALLKGL